MQPKTEIGCEVETKESNDFADQNEQCVNASDALSAVVAKELERKACEEQVQNEEVTQADHEQKDDAFENQTHQKQMAFIERQIAQTKLELKESEAKIHRRHLEEISPFAESHPMKRAYDMRYRKKKSTFY